MGAVDITARLREWVAKAITDGCMGEEFWYDTDWVANPAVGQMVYNVVVVMRNPLLGQGPLVGGIQVSIADMRQDVVGQGVHAIMGQLRQRHRDALKAISAPRPPVS